MSRKNKNLKNYLTVLKKEPKLNITVIGKDPYPNDATGIPFCKPAWNLMCQQGVSGFDVLSSLGVDINAAQQLHSTPEDLFIALAKNRGIAFLNLSYTYLNSPCRKGKHKFELHSAELINRNILKKSKIVIFCGEAKKHRWYGIPHKNSFEAVHPDTRCKISRSSKVRSEWVKWWTSNAVATRFKLKTYP